MDLHALNALSEADAATELKRCCGSSRWAANMAATRPFSSADDLFITADAIWADCSEADFLEAFTHHPKIGNLDSLEKKFASTASWSEGEQSSVNTAPREVLLRLQSGNEEYDQKNGFIFIVCATGKSASEMLELLEARLPNDRATELKNAAEEQRKITRIRLEKLLEA